jgi:alpha-L-fucosidase
MFAHPVSFDRVMTMERLNDGQHVEEYSVEVLSNGNWKQVAHAYAIGHKKIDIFEPVTTTGVRLKLLETSGQPAIREFGVFNGAAVH